MFKILKTTHGDITLSRAVVYRWYAAFRSGKLRGGPGVLHTKLTDRTANTAAAIMQDNARMMVSDLANILQIAVDSAHHLLIKILGLSRVRACLIPRLITVKHKENHVRIMGEWIQHLEEDETWFNNIITCDEMWLYQYDPEMKQQSSQWVKKSTGPPKKACAQKSGLKGMLKGMIFTYYVPEGQTINTKYYKTVLMTLIRIHIPRKNPYTATAISSCITIMPTPTLRMKSSNFWLQKTSKSFHTRHTVPI